MRQFAKLRPVKAETSSTLVLSAMMFDKPMAIDELFDFLNNPRDITLEEFTKIIWFMSLSVERIKERTLQGKEIIDIALAVGLVPSKGEFRKRAEAFKVSEFFQTGIPNLTFAVIRMGKKKHEIIFGSASRADHDVCKT